MTGLVIVKHLLDREKTAYNTGFASDGLTCKLSA
jgi:hypothetical protein